MIDLLLLILGIRGAIVEVNSKCPVPESVVYEFVWSNDMDKAMGDTHLVRDKDYWLYELYPYALYNSPKPLSVGDKVCYIER